MPGNEELVFSSKARYGGIFLFEDFYKFCYQWLKDEVNLIIVEDKYYEKLVGDLKNIKIKWTGTRKITDYFKFKIEVDFEITGLAKVEISQAGTKISTNKRTVGIAV